MSVLLPPHLKIRQEQYLSQQSAQPEKWARSVHGLIWVDIEFKGITEEILVSKFATIKQAKLKYIDHLKSEVSKSPQVQELAKEVDIFAITEDNLQFYKLEVNDDTFIYSESENEAKRTYTKHILPDSLQINQIPKIYYERGINAEDLKQPEDTQYQIGITNTTAVPIDSQPYEKLLNPQRDHEQNRQIITIIYLLIVHIILLIFKFRVFKNHNKNKYIISILTSLLISLYIFWCYYYVIDRQKIYIIVFGILTLISYSIVTFFDYNKRYVMDNRILESILVGCVLLIIFMAFYLSP